MAGLFGQAELAGLQVEDHVVGEEEREARVHVVVRFSRRIVLHVNVAGVDHRGGLELEEPCGSTPGGAGREFECQFVIQVADVLVRVVPGDKPAVLRREGLGTVLSIVQRGRRPGIWEHSDPRAPKGTIVLVIGDLDGGGEDLLSKYLSPVDVVLLPAAVSGFIAR